MRSLAALLLILPSPGMSAVPTRVSVPGRAVTAPVMHSASLPSLAAPMPYLPSPLLPLTPSLGDAPKPSFAVPSSLAPFRALFPAAAEAPKAQAAANAQAASSVAPISDEEAAEPEVEAAAEAERQGRVKAHIERVFDGTAEMRRPLEESWVVGGVSYASTQELLRAVPSLEAKTPAEYRYAHVPVKPLRKGERPAGFALAGAAVALVIGAAGLLIHAGLEGTLAFVLAPDPASAVAVASVVGASLAAGALFGLIVSLEDGKEAVLPPNVTSIKGVLELRDGPIGPRPFFVARRGRETTVAALTAHAFAEELEEEELPEPLDPFTSALLGAAAGAAVAVAQWIPLVQIFTLPALGPTVGAYLGKALGRDGRLPWGVVGGSLGFLAPMGAFLSFAAAGRYDFWTVALWYVVAFAVAGALLGIPGVNAYRDLEASDKLRNPAGQWWAKRPEQEEPTGRY